MMDLLNRKKLSWIKENLDEINLPKYSIVKSIDDYQNFLAMVTIQKVSCKLSSSENDLIFLYDLSKKLYQNELNNAKLMIKKFDITEFSNDKVFKDVIMENAVVIMKNPFHSIYHLKFVMEQFSSLKRNKKDRLYLAEILNNIYSTYLLPDRKLCRFNQWSFHKIYDGFPQDKLIGILISIFYEDFLKNSVDDFISGIFLFLNDNSPEIRIKALSLLGNFILKKPENEKIILQNLINKIGDSSKKISSNACQYLSKLVFQNPLTGPYVIDELQLFILRKNLPYRSIFRSICLINRVFFCGKNKETAIRSLKLLLGLFQNFSKDKDNSHDQKILLFIIKGIQMITTKIGDCYVNMSPFYDSLSQLLKNENTSVSFQTGLLLLNLSKSDDYVVEVLNILKEKLLVADNIIHLNEKNMINSLNLIDLVLSKNCSEDKIMEIFHILMQISCHSGFKFSTQMLNRLAKALNENITLKSKIFASKQSSFIKSKPIPFISKMNKDSNDVYFDDDEVEYFEDLDRIDEDNEKSSEVLKEISNKNSFKNGKNNSHFDYEKTVDFKDKFWEIACLRKHFNYGVVRATDSFFNQIHTPNKKKLQDQIIKPHVSTEASNSNDKLSSYYSDTTLMRFLDSVIKKFNIHSSDKFCCDNGYLVVETKHKKLTKRRTPRTDSDEDVNDMDEFEYDDHSDEYDDSLLSDENIESFDDDSKVTNKSSFNINKKFKPHGFKKNKRMKAN